MHCLKKALSWAGVLLLVSLLHTACNRNLSKEETIKVRMTRYLRIAEENLKSYNLDETGMYIDSASLFLSRIDNPSTLGLYYHIKGIYAQYRQEEEEAHRNYYEAMTQYEKVGNKDQLIPIYYNLALSYIQRQDTTRLKEMIDKLYPLAQQKEQSIIDFYELKGYYFNSLYNEERKNPAVPDSILYYERKVVAEFENDPKIREQKRDIAYNYIMMADAFISKASIDSTTYYLRKAEQWSNEADSAMSANIEWIKGKLAYKQGDFRSAQSIFQRLSALIEDKYPSLCVNIYEYMANISEKERRLQATLEYERKRTKILERIHATEKYWTITELETKYETESKTREIEQLKEVNRFQILTNRLYLGCMGLLLVIAAFMLKQIYDRKEKDQLKEQLKEFQLKKYKFDKAKNELSKQITNNKEIASEQKNEYLSKLQQINDKFYLSLTTQYSGDLSATSLQYCLCFLIDMDIQHMAACLSIDSRSVHVVRHRLRAKFNLDKGTDLTCFFKQLNTHK